MPVFVLLLRSGDEPDAYEDTLEADGYEVSCMPVLAFENVNEQDLREALERPARYDGLVFTSPRAVDAFGEAMPWLPTENVLWHGKPVYAVGPRTADALRTIGFTPEGEESGSAERLAERIRKQDFERPLLFLCGSRRRDVLPDLLASSGIEVEEICVYDTRLRDGLAWPPGRKPDWLVFFSPSGFEAVRRAGLPLEGVRVAAIGPTTADVLRAHGVPVAGVADEPTPEQLRMAIRRADVG